MTFKKIRPRYIAKKKSKAAQEAIDRLNAYLNAAEPEPVYWLTRLWDDQQQAVTYKELREAIAAGRLDEKTLAAWQEDYANFVNDKLKPIWTQAMEEGAAKLMAEHPDFFFDPMTEGIHNWTVTHGAEWVTKVSDEQRDAIAAMVEHATTGAWTVDELSRAIRPTIGLTAPQALANLKYYERVKSSLLDNNPTMKEATATKRAQEAAQKYAARQHRARAYTIATTELAFAYNKGQDDAVKQAIQQGYLGKSKRVWSTAADDGVCPICSALDGVAIDMDGEFDFKGKPLYGGQKETPPAHPRCRCAVEYQEIEPPQIPQATPEPPQTWSGQQPAPDIPEPETPAIPQGLAIPDGMTYQGHANLGGTGEMYAYKDGAGQDWLFKPAQSKGGTPEAFRAYVQEAGYKVQSIIDPDTAVPVGVGDIGGQFGAFQKRITTAGSGPSFKAWQYSTDPLPPGAAAQFQREHVTDWLLGNFDSHGGNFIIDSQGRIVGIDKEQAFKYIGQDASKAMSYAYHPNKGYGETEPIYNTMYRRFAKGEIDLDLQDTLAYIKRVEAIPDSEYREIFRDYAEALHGKGPQAEALLDAIVERKSTLRETYRAFYSDLLTERTGKKQVFIWADEAAQKAAQPLAAVTHTPDVLKKMNVSELKQLAKQKGIPYYNKFTKPQLVEAISDPVKAVEISAKTKAKLLNLEATRPQRLATAPPRTPAAPKGALKAGKLFDDFSTIPAGQRIGVPVYSDHDRLEGLNMTARRMNVDGAEVYELTGKLTDGAWGDALHLVRANGTDGSMAFEMADDTAAFLSTRPVVMRGVDLQKVVLEDSGSTLEVYTHGAKEYNGWTGFFRLRVPATGSGAADAKAAKNLLERAGMVDLTGTPTAQAEAIYKKTRLLWQNAPGEIGKIRGLTGQDLSDELDRLLDAAGVTAKRIKRTTMKKVFDGYQTLVEEGVAKDYEKAGLRYIWSGVPSSDGVVSIIKGPGLMSTNTRCHAGMEFFGASPQADMRSGGSDSVFTRIGVVTKDGKSPGRFGQCYKGSGYRVMVDPAVMERTDWYAYDSDSFGRSTASALATRQTPLDFIRSMADDYHSDNEVMFRHGIPKEQFIGIACPDDYYRQELLDKLKAEGITEINGQAIEDFVKVRNDI
nr:phage minor head protein [uncultured Dysosmobacter sp.]